MISFSVLATACGSDDNSAEDATVEAPATTVEAPATTVAAPPTTVEAPPTTEGAATGTSLKGICPDTIVIQTDWFPEAEHGALYELIGDDYKVDGDNNVVSGSLIGSGGASTGIGIEVRSGGPSVGFQGPDAQMYTDPSITMGYSGTGAAATFAKTPLLSVVAPLEKNPQIILWDPATYPDVKTIDDLGKAGVTLNLFSTATMDFFVADGRYPPELLDPSYDGSPARFIAEQGKIGQQGFASAEPYQYENEFKEWGKPVAFQTFYDAGYQDYSQTIGIRPDDLETLRPCLEKFVPMVQQAAVDFINSPERANAIIIDAVKTMDDFWVYGEGVAAFSVQQQKDLGLVSNGPDDTLGNFDMARVQKYVDQMIATGKFPDIPKDFTIDMEVTNEFIDPSIGL